MKDLLSKKLEGTQAYNRKELLWLIDHIGDTDPAIRDQLVYSSFCHALLDHLIEPELFSYIFDELKQRNILFYKIEEKGAATLTRSFTALVFALILDREATVDSPYYHLLSENDRQAIFNYAFEYLKSETDVTGWSADYGWVHSLAHGSEFLLYVGLHDAFPKERIAEILDTLTHVLKKQTQVFTAGEDRRIAILLAQLILQKKLTQEQIADWIEDLDFLDQSPETYFASLNLENVLICLYFSLEKENALTARLKEILLNSWKGY